MVNLKNKNYKEFWNDVHNTYKHNDPQAPEIDGVRSNDDISNLFSHKYKDIFNKKRNIEKCMKYTNLSEKKKVTLLLMFSRRDIRNCVKQLRETLGFDKIHSNHLKFNSELLHDFIAKLFSSFIIHNFLPSEMIKGIITPIVKNKLGNLYSSD